MTPFSYSSATLSTLILRALDHLVLLGRDDHVVDGDGHAALGRPLESGLLDGVEEHAGLLVAGDAEIPIDGGRDGLLVEALVDESQFLGDDLVEDGAADRGFDDLAVHQDLDGNMQLHAARFQAGHGFVDAGEHLARALALGLHGRQVIAAEHDILRRHRDGLARSGMQDVVGGHHQDAAFQLRLEGERQDGWPSDRRRNRR